MRVTPSIAATPPLLAAPPLLAGRTAQQTSVVCAADDCTGETSSGPQSSVSSSSASCSSAPSGLLGQQQDVAYAVQDSTSSTSLLLGILPTALRQAFSDIESRSVLDCAGEDYAVYYVPEEGDASISNTSFAWSDKPTQNPSALLSGSLLVQAAKGLASKISPAKKKSTGHSGVATESSHRTCCRIAGHCEAYVHENSSNLVRDFLDVTNPMFILGSSIALRGPKRAWRPNQGQKRTLTVATNPTAPHESVLNDDAEVFLPLVIDKASDSNMLLLIYKRLRSDPSEDVLAEVLCEVVIEKVVAEQGAVVFVLHFKAADEALLGDEARAKVNKKRARVACDFKTIVPGVEEGYLIVENDHIGCSRVKMCIMGEFDIAIPYKDRKKLIARSFEPLKVAQSKYERRDLVDDLMRRHFVSKIESVPPATKAETKLLTDSMACLMDGSDFKRVVGSLKAHPTVHMFLRGDRTDGVGVWSKCYGFVDESPALVLAWNWHLCSYERRKAHNKANGQLALKTNATDSSRTQVSESEYRVAPGIANRCGVLT